mmetsp:Transcript_28854/g.97263  ORF Transcript_28854/g.97263 Transcript_28854/m.97263 type:complete len:211 (-) Transcript_28854:1421-2053(-)
MPSSSWITCRLFRWRNMISWSASSSVSSSRRAPSSASTCPRERARRWALPLSNSRRPRRRRRRSASSTATRWTSRTCSAWWPSRSWSVCSLWRRSTWRVLRRRSNLDSTRARGSVMCCTATSSSSGTTTRRRSCGPRGWHSRRWSTEASARRRAACTGASSTRSGPLMGRSWRRSIRRAWRCGATPPSPSRADSPTTASRRSSSRRRRTS